MWSLKYGTNGPIYRTESDSQTENRLVVAKGEERESGTGLEFGVSRYKLLIFRMDKQ